MEKVIRVDSVTRCNDLLHQKTQHPLAGVVKLSDRAPRTSLMLDFYAVLLEDGASGDRSNGWRPYDFSAGTVVFFSPDSLVDIKADANWCENQGYLLIFHPELVKGTSLDGHIGDYSFFRYRQNEALHISEREKKVLLAGMKSISDELDWGIDEYSKTLIVNKIETLLNYCSRFYKRQFITRHEANEKIVKRTEQLVEDYFLTRQEHCKSLPTARSLACSFDLSTDYFEDLLKHETGKAMSEYVRFKRIDIAREQLSKGTKTVDQIAKNLGFATSQSFCRMFKRLTGRTPDEYSMMN